MARFDYTSLFRLLLVLAVAASGYFAFTPVEHPGIARIYDKVQHLVTFLVLAGLADRSFPRIDIYRKLLAVLAYGIFIEVVQYFLSYRTFSLLDMLTDALALALYRAALPVAACLRRGVRGMVAGGARPEDEEDRS